MPDFFPNLLIWLKNLRHAESWVRMTSGLAIVGLLASMALILLQTTTDWPKAIGWWAFLTIAVTGTLIWFVARSIYWRTGSRHKIGVFFRAFNVEIRDWLEVRQKLTALLRDNELPNPISIRAFPEAWIDDADRLRKLRRRYGLAGTFRVTHTPNSVGNDPIQRHVITIVDDHDIAADLKAETKRCETALMAPPPPGQDILDVLHWRAGRLAEIVLLNIAVLEYSRREYVSAAAFFGVIDRMISDRFEETEYPRLHVRWLESVSLCLPGAFPGAEPPGPEALALAVEKGELAVTRFQHQFPHVLITQARNLFYMNRLEDALTLSLRAIERLKTPRLKATAILNAAVLHLFLEHWDSAHKFFVIFFSQPKWREFDWVDLVGFADFSRELGFSSAVYLQCLYRHFAGIGIDQSLKVDLSNILNADASRHELLYLYNKITMRKKTSFRL